MRKLSPLGLLLVIGVVLVVLGGKALQSRVAPGIRRAHTGALFSEIRFDSSLPPDIQSMAELAQHLSDRTLDWNSCALVDGAILDGRGRVVTFASLDDGGFQLHSSGADGIFGTDDDIITEVQPPESTSPEEPTG